MRLYRPHIPLEVRCRVAMRQSGEMFPDDIIKEYRGRLQGLLDDLLLGLRMLLSPERSDGELVKLHLDHDPPLAARPRFRAGLGRTRYEPDANDPEFLFYRTKADHDVKTRIRGEHGQYRDLALIKRARKKAKKDRRPKRRWPSRPFPKVKRKIASRGFRRPR
jgi:hypothetical protein